jgi:thymidylate synthase ThyX
MRPEFQNYKELEEDFFEEAEHQFDRYDLTRKKWGRILEAKLSADALAALGRSGLRKLKNQVARTFLGNFVEAPIYVSMNTRALRHFMNMRGSKFAETEIRALSLKLFELVSVELPHILQDVSIEELPDGSSGLHLQYPKV